MNGLFMLNEHAIHQQRTGYSSSMNGMFISGIFLFIVNVLYINELYNHQNQAGMSARSTANFYYIFIVPSIGTGKKSH